MPDELTSPSKINSGVRVSVVIPAFNEERRLPRTLNLIERVLNQHFPDSYEIIVVDDGSRDHTCALVEEYAKRSPNLRLIRLPSNQGRGVAVRVGALAACGQFILETDSDGSVDEEAIPRFVGFFEDNPGIDVLIGSRNVQGARILTAQPILRVLLGHGFLFLAKICFGGDIRDYTLGFKMFVSSAARDIFQHQFDSGYFAEAELVFIARRRGWRLKELPVLWTDYKDSRVRPFRDSWRSFKGLMIALTRDLQGKYTADLPHARTRTP
jgi:dolichyl-phosphate beta-glucosyltransferase